MNIENERVKHIRADLLRVTQEEFAAQIGCSTGTVSGIEQGTSKVSLKTALLICKKYHYSLDYIYGLTEDKKDSAGTMLLYLKNLFDYRTDTRSDKYPHILSIKKCAVDFLNGYDQASRMFRSRAIPEAAYTSWIEMLKTNYNHDMETERVVENFHLVPQGEFDAFLAYTYRSKREIVRQAIKSHDVKFTSEAAEQNFIDNAINKLSILNGDIQDFDTYLKDQIQSDPGAFKSDEPMPRFSRVIGPGG